MKNELGRKEGMKDRGMRDGRDGKAHIFMTNKQKLNGAKFSLGFFWHKNDPFLFPSKNVQKLFDTHVLKG